MKKFSIHFITFIFLLFVFISPHIVLAQFGQIIPCTDNCTFGDLVTLVKNVINALIKLATLVTTGVLSYAGFKMLFSGGSESVWKDAKEMMRKTIIGYVWILVAWTLIYTITSVILAPGFSLLGNPNS